MRVFGLIILISTSFFQLKGQTISASPGWTYTLSGSDISEAGNNYNVNIESGANQTLVDVTTNSFYNSNFRVSVEKIDNVWNNQLTLSVRRTGNGSGGWFAGISGGTNYIQLTNTPQLLYTGNTGYFSGGYFSVPIQYRVQGLSLLVPAQSYSTTVRYTITN
ncbi:hypothetical protein [Jiulongibacter sediminis]|jgi:hypothetical protein|uniref:hypothetical protein n=1 Tax=Jiulongibacter sediminis TaxID=1605367 RepID=UPI0026E99032|nr:hypothetical protein [Jiulongibacter sediminis]